VQAEEQVRERHGEPVKGNTGRAGGNDLVGLGVGLCLPLVHLRNDIMNKQMTKPTQQAFGSSGGKHFLAKKIAPLIPEHETYVEPYAGGAAVYFYKEPSEKEVLNDKDKEIAFAYRFIRDMSPEQYERLKGKDWTISRERFDRTKASKPENDVDRFYKFYYTKKGSYNTMGECVNVGQIGDKATNIDRLLKVQQRLKGTATNSSDALKMIDKHDSKNTFFYIDPPYPDRAGYNTAEFTKEDLKKLTDRLRHIKGKFLLSIDKENAKQLPSQFDTKRITTLRSYCQGSGTATETEILASNYDLRNKKLEKHAENFARTGHIE